MNPLPSQIQITGVPASAPQQVMPSNHPQGNSNNSLPISPQIHPQLATTTDPRIPISPISSPLPPFMHALNQPFPFQNAMPQLGPRGPLPHPVQFRSELRPQNLNSVAANPCNYSLPNDQSFGVNSVYLAPIINHIRRFHNGQNVWRRPMPTNQFIPTQTPNYTHFVPPTNWPVAPQNGGLIPAQQFGPRPVHPFAQQAQNFRPEQQNKMKSKSRKNKRRKKQEQEKESEAPTAEVDAADLEKKHIGSTKDKEKMISLENESAETKDNFVLRKLLRGPRYFDSPESWDEEVCQKCGKDHKTGDCFVQKRKKPCFICGCFDHTGKAKGGFNCNISHLIKECLEKDPKVSESYRICVRCGDPGHSMFFCKNDYSPDDLKQIKCYICNEFGHLCCAEYVDEGPKQNSCYKCGELGHLGPGCPKREGQSGGSGAANLCDSCGEKGHVAIDCQKNAKKDECIGELPATVETLSSKEKEEEDQVGTEACKSLSKQNDATQGSSSSSASVLVQV